ncbi:MAG TPA: hypothetical protein VNH80_02575, partial [Burkholderiales bacterium]|nr:hypothetical protein [Burkholderiales bacterium]
MTAADKSAKPYRYWAAIPQSDQYVGEALERINRYRRWLSQTGRADRMQRSFRARYGWAPDGDGNTAQVRASGVQGELVDVTTNDYAALMDQSQTLITSQKPAFKAVPNNGDYKSRAAVRLAEAIIEDYERKESLSEMDADTVRCALLASEGWRIQGWNASAGRIVRQDAVGNGIAEGDVVERVYTPYDMALDPDCRSIERLPWIGFREPYNRHDLAALFEASDPDLAERIKSVTSQDGETSQWDQLYDLRNRTGYRQMESDDYVFVWEMRHPPSPAMRLGRLVRFIDSSTIIYDSMNARMPATQGEQAQAESAGQTFNAGYPYGRELHAYCLSPERVLGSTAGHTAHFDLLGLQQCMDTVVTMAASAANAGGVSNLWTPERNNVSVDELAGGFNHIVSPVKPENIEGPKLDPQATMFGELVMQLMRRRIGMNDAALGEPTKGMPAQLAALLEAQAVQFHNGLQSSYQRMLEQTRTGRLKLLQRFPASKRVAEVAGANGAWALSEWEAQDLESVERVSVEAINPAMRTFAGRLSLAQMLLDKSLITAKQFMDLVISGRLDDEWDFDEKNKARIQQEKELLLGGASLPPVDPAQSKQAGRPIFVQPPPVPGKPPPKFIRPHLAQTHWLDIPEYLSVIASPDALNQPALVTAVLDLVHYKLDLWRQMDP